MFKNFFGYIIALLLIPELFISCNSNKNELVLASNGRSDYQIILPEEGNEKLQQAAQLMKDAFSANGFNVPLLTEKQDDPSKPGIYLGDTEYSRSKGIEPTQFEDWAYLLRVVDSDLIITGSDNGHRMGVVKGLCDFLREYAGTRFLYPGRTGTGFLSMPVISVPANLNLSRKPWLKFNDTGNLYPEEWLYNVAGNQFPAGYQHTGHMYHRAIPHSQYYRVHPEYFALIDGKRDDRDAYTQYCISNPQVMDLILQFLIRTADQGDEYVYLGQPDGFRPCECKECFMQYGTGDDWDEKIWLFHRDLAEGLLKDRPGKKIILLAYQATTHPPKTFKEFPDNTMIYLSHTYEEALNEWEQSGVMVPGGFVGGLRYGSHFFTNYLPKRTPYWWEAQVRRLYKHHFVGLKRQGALCSYGLEGPMFYTWGRMIDDPENNTAETLLEEYYLPAFGKAADPMRIFYDVLHERIRIFTDWLCPRSATHFRMGISGGKPKNIDDPLDWTRVSTAQFGSRGMKRGITDPGQAISIVFTPDMVMQMEEALRQAEEIVVKDKVRLRLALVRMEFNYLKHVAAVNALYNGYVIHPDQAALHRLLAAIDAFNDLLDSYYDETGKMISIPGWPEMRPFRNKGRSELGLITARWWSRKDKSDNPFAWDTEEVRYSGISKAFD